VADLVSVLRAGDGAGGPEWAFAEIVRRFQDRVFAQYRLLWRCRAAAAKGGGWRQGGSRGLAATPLGRWWRPSAAPPETAVAPYL